MPSFSLIISVRIDSLKGLITNLMEKLDIIKALEGYGKEEGITFLSEEDAVKYWGGLVDIIEGLTSQAKNDEDTFQIAVMGDVCSRLADVAYDIVLIPGWEQDGRLLGIKSVCEGQIPRLQNLVTRLKPIPNSN